MPHPLAGAAKATAARNPMQSQQLQHFVAAVTYGNFSRAAEMCNVTQPAITRSVQRLEVTLGVQLLERSTRGVSPTAAGELLYEYACRHARETRLVRQRIADISGQPLGEIRVGVSANVQHEGLAAALTSVMRQAPERRLSIVQDFYTPLFDRLAAGDIDVLVTMLPQDIDEREFSCVELREIPGALFVGVTHPLAGRNRGRVGLLDLARHKWVVLGQRDQGYLESRFGPYDIQPPDITVTTNSPLLMKELLLATTMIGLAPQHLFAAEVQVGNLVSLDSELEPLSARRGIVRRRNAGRSPQLDRFIDEFQAAYLAILAPDDAPREGEARAAGAGSETGQKETGQNS